MQNTRSIITEAQMALGNEVPTQSALTATRLGFDPAKLSANSNRQTKAATGKR